MKLTDCIITENGITCFYNTNLIKASNFMNINNAIHNINSHALNYFIGYITLRISEIIIVDIINNIDNIKNLDNYSLLFN